MKTRCKLGTATGLCPIRCGRGWGAGGEPRPHRQPRVQAVAYLRCYHITSSSPSSAGSINGRGCFPQGTSTVRKPRSRGSGLDSSPVLGVLETHGARRVPVASAAAARPGAGSALPGGAAPTPTPIRRCRLGFGDAALCSVVPASRSSCPRQAPRPPPQSPQQSHFSAEVVQKPPW